MGLKSAQRIWETALGELQLQVSKQNYRTWLEKTVGLSYEDNTFTIGAPNTFTTEYLDKKLRSLVEKTLIGLTTDDIKLVFQVNNGNQGLPENGGAHTGAITSTPTPRATFNVRYTFDSFVAGNCNQLARSAALAVAENPGQQYNPLFIYGGVGLGKTHLLQAIGLAALARHRNALYVSAEKYTNEFITALREGKTKDFHNKYRNVDILLVDDIRFISGKEQTEESFFYTFNELHNANRQIVISSDLPPKSLPLLQKRLRSRFEGGLVATIEPPDFETRQAIVRNKAELQGVDIPAEALDVIAQPAEQSVRQLEGLLNRVIAFSRLVRAEITPELAARAITDIADGKTQATPPTTKAVIQAVAESFGLAIGDITARKRDKQTILARQIAMYLLRQETDCSFAQIGQELGGRDHSTVIHACERVSTELSSNHILKTKIADVQKRLRAGVSLGG
jgi:chromosomal replication initiator protein